AITVEAAAWLALCVAAKAGNHFCDTPIVDLAIVEVGGSSRRWGLAHDVVDSIRTGNPHADSYGTSDVWRFGSAAAPQSPPAPSEPPFSLSSTALSARSFVKELAAKKLKTVREQVREQSEQSWV